MTLGDDLRASVKETFSKQWTKRESDSVPSTDDVKLGNDAVTLEAGTVLYADLSGSTGLVQGHKDFFAAEIYKTYLYCAAKCAQHGSWIRRLVGPHVTSTAPEGASRIDCSLRQLVAGEGAYPRHETIRGRGRRAVTTTDVAASGMTASDWTISILTGVLVIATIYYARQTWRMVGEMRRARELQVRPCLVPAIRVLGPNDFYPKVANTGAGPAIDVRVTLTLEPDGPAAGYAAPVMPPGSDAGVIVRDGSRKIMDIDDYAPFSTVRMRGTCRDVLESSFEIDEAFDLRGFMDGFKSGMWARFPGVKKDGTPLKLIAEALVNIESMMKADREVY